MWLLANWKMVAIGTAIIAVFGAGVHVRGLWDESRLESKLKAQEAALNEDCAKQQKLAQGVSDAYQKKLNATTARYNDALRQLRSSSGNSLPTGAASRPNATTSGERLYWTDENVARAALDLAATADRQTQQLLACQDFIRKERE